MTLKVREEKVLHNLPSTMKQSMDQDDKCYFTHEIDLPIANFVHDVFMVNPLREYFEGKLER